MSEQSTGRLDGLDHAGLAHSTRAGRGWLRLAYHWELVVAAVALFAAAVAVWLTLRAGFLAYPGWSAVQKADFILGPVGVGLYWHHRRPNNRFGLLLIVLGLLGVPYVLASSANPTLFATGVLAEDPIYVMAYVVILAFPSGRLEGLPERLVLALLIIFTVLVLVVTLTLSHLAPGLSISGCRRAPRTWLSMWYERGERTPRPVFGQATTGRDRARHGSCNRVAIRHRHAASASRARDRRAGRFAVSVSEAAYRALFLFAPNGLAPSARPIQDILQWALAATRSFIWYGFLFALIAAELFAGRVLRNVVRRSLGRPSLRDLEGMLREPLGDPGLRLGFWAPVPAIGSGTTAPCSLPPSPAK